MYLVLLAPLKDASTNEDMVSKITQLQQLGINEVRDLYVQLKVVDYRLCMVNSRELHVILWVQV